MKKGNIFILILIGVQVIFAQMKDAKQLYRYRNSQFLVEFQYSKYEVSAKDSFEIKIRIKNLTDSILKIYSPEYMNCSFKKGELIIWLGMYDQSQEYFGTIGFIKLPPKEEEQFKLVIRSPGLKLLNIGQKISVEFYFFCSSLKIWGGEAQIPHTPVQLYSFVHREKKRLFEFKYQGKHKIIDYKNPYLECDGQVYPEKLPSFVIK